MTKRELDRRAVHRLATIRPALDDAAGTWVADVTVNETGLAELILGILAAEVDGPVREDPDTSTDHGTSSDQGSDWHPLVRGACAGCLGSAQARSLRSIERAGGAPHRIG